MFFRMLEKFIILFIFVIFIFSCSDSEAIFASIESEEKIETSNLSDRITGLGMAKMNGYYFIATGLRMFHRKENASEWDNTSIANGFTAVSGISQYSPNTDAYFVAYEEAEGKNSIARSAVYKIPTQAGSNFPSISKISDTAFVKVFTLPTTVIGFTTPANFVHNYYRDIDGTPVLIAENQESPIVDVEVFNNVEYLLTQDSLYTITNNALVKVDVQTADNTKLTGLLSNIYAFTDIDNNNTPTMVLSNKSYIWRTTDGSTWTRSTNHGSSYFFTSFAYIDQPAFRGLIVGTKYYPIFGRDLGYRELPSSAPKADGTGGGVNISSLVTPSGNKYTSGSLKKAGVLDFFVDGNTFFVLTKGNGIWRGTYSNTRSIDWFQE